MHLSVYHPCIKKIYPCIMQITPFFFCNSARNVGHADTGPAYLPYGLDFAKFLDAEYLGDASDSDFESDSDSRMRIVRQSQGAVFPHMLRLIQTLSLSHQLTVRQW